MKLLFLIPLLLLAGCAGSPKVSWSFTASYNTLVQQMNAVQHVPDEEKKK